MRNDRRADCPICSGEMLPDDASIAGKGETDVVIQGRVNAISRPGDMGHFPPFSDFCTVPIYPRKGRVKYLKFRTRRDLERWNFVVNDKVQIEGCFHIVDDKQLIFDVHHVVHDPAE